MPPVKDFLKENPLKVAAGTVSALMVLIGAVLSFDARYAHALDVQQYQKQVSADITIQTASLRKQLLEDKLFELDAKKGQRRLDPVEAATYERYQRQLQEVTSQIQFNRQQR